MLTTELERSSMHFGGRFKLGWYPQVSRRNKSGSSILPVYRKVHIIATRVQGRRYPLSAKMGLGTLLKDYSTQLLDAIRSGDVERFRDIVERHVHTKARIAKLCQLDLKHRPTKRFACPLILAARQPSGELLHYMLSCGANPNFVHRTVRAGQAKTAAVNADNNGGDNNNAPSSRKGDSLTPLQVAIDVSSYECVELLLTKGADPNVADHKGDWPLIIATRKADSTLVRMLLAKGADTTTVDKHGNAPLHIASLYGHLQIAEALLKHNADIYQKGAQDYLPMHIAAKGDHVHLIQLFCRHDIASINVKVSCQPSLREQSPLHLAAENGNYRTVNSLLAECDADVMITDSQANTSLHCVVLNGYSPMRMRDRDDFTSTARILLECGADPNARNDKKCETPLHLAARHHFPRIVELLLDYGANPLAETSTGTKAVNMVSDSDPATKNILKSAMKGTRKVNESSLTNLRSRQPSQSTLFAKSTPLMSRRNPISDTNISLEHRDNNEQDSQNYEDAFLSNDQIADQRHRSRSKSTEPEYARSNRTRNVSASERISSSHRSLNQHPVKSAKPSRDEVEKRRRRLKQKNSIDKLLNKEKVRLKSKYSDGDSTSIQSEGVHEMSSELKEIFERVMKKSDSKKSPVKGKKRAPTPPDNVYANENFDRSIYGQDPYGQQLVAYDPNTYYPNDYTYEQMLAYSQAMGQNYLNEQYYPSDVNVYTDQKKPGVIEVEYSGGPITIAVESKKTNNLNERPAITASRGEPITISNSVQGSRVDLTGLPPSGYSDLERRHNQSADELRPRVERDIDKPLNLSFAGETSTFNDFSDEKFKLLLNSIGDGHSTFEVNGQVGHIVQGQFIPYPLDVQTYYRNQQKQMSDKENVQPVVNFQMAKTKQPPPDQSLNPEPDIIQLQDTNKDSTPIPTIRKSLSNINIKSESTSIYSSDEESQGSVDVYIVNKLDDSGDESEVSFLSSDDSLIINTTDDDDDNDEINSLQLDNDFNYLREKQNMIDRELELVELTEKFEAQINDQKKIIEEQELLLFAASKRHQDITSEERSSDDIPSPDISPNGTPGGTPKQLPSSRRKHFFAPQIKSRSNTPVKQDNNEINKVEDNEKYLIDENKKNIHSTDEDTLSEGIEDEDDYKTNETIKEANMGYMKSENKFTTVNLNTSDELITEDSEMNTSADLTSDRGSSPVFSEGGSRYLTSKLGERGIGIRVSGEVPKAYRKIDNESARRAFMLSMPIGLESSDDSDLSGSRLSLYSSSDNFGSKERFDIKSHEHKGENQVKNLQKQYSYDKKSVKESGLIGSSLIAKPYESFGNISTDTTAIDEALARSNDSSFGSIDEIYEKNVRLIEKTSAKRKLTCEHDDERHIIKDKSKNPMENIKQIPISDNKNIERTILSKETVENSNKKVDKHPQISNIDNKNSEDSNNLKNDKNNITNTNEKIISIDNDELNNSDIAKRPDCLPSELDTSISIRKTKKIKIPIKLESPISNIKITDYESEDLINNRIEAEDDIILETPNDPDLNTSTITYNAPKAERKAAKIAEKLKRKQKRLEKREKKELKRLNKSKENILDYDAVTNNYDDDISKLNSSEENITNINNENENIKNISDINRETNEIKIISNRNSDIEDIKNNYEEEESNINFEKDFVLLNDIEIVEDCINKSNEESDSIIKEKQLKRLAKMKRKDVRKEKREKKLEKKKCKLSQSEENIILSESSEIFFDISDEIQNKISHEIPIVSNNEESVIESVIKGEQTIDKSNILLTEKNERKIARMEKRRKKAEKKEEKLSKIKSNKLSDNEDLDQENDNDELHNVIEIATFDAFAVEVNPNIDNFEDLEENESSQNNSSMNDSYNIAEKRSRAIEDLMNKCNEVEEVTKAYHTRIRDQMASPEESSIENEEESINVQDNIELLRKLSEKTYSYNEEQTKKDDNARKSKEIVHSSDNTISLKSDLPPTFDAPPIPHNKYDQLIPIEDNILKESDEIEYVNLSDIKKNQDDIIIESKKNINEYYNLSDLKRHQDTLYENIDNIHRNYKENTYMNIDKLERNTKDDQIEYVNTNELILSKETINTNCRHHESDVEYINYNELNKINKQNVVENIDPEYMNTRDLKRKSINRRKPNTQINKKEEFNQYMDEHIDPEYMNTKDLKRIAPIMTKSNAQINKKEECNQYIDENIDPEYMNTKDLKRITRNSSKPKTHINEEGEYMNINELSRISRNTNEISIDHEQKNNHNKIKFKRPELRKSNENIKIDDKKPNKSKRIKDRPQSKAPLPPLPKREEKIKESKYNEEYVEYSNLPLKRSMECEDLRISDRIIENLKTDKEDKNEIINNTNEYEKENVDEHKTSIVNKINQKKSKKIIPIVLKNKKRRSRENHEINEQISSVEDLLTSSIPRIHPHDNDENMIDKLPDNQPLEQSSFEENSIIHSSINPLHGIYMERTTTVSSSLSSSTSSKHDLSFQPAVPINASSKKAEFSNVTPEVEPSEVFVEETAQWEGVHEKSYDPAYAYTNPSSTYPDPSLAYYDEQGRVYDPATGLYYEESTGQYFDPAVGFHYDYNEQQYYDVVTGLYYDPQTGAFFDSTGMVHGYHESFYYYADDPTSKEQQPLWDEYSQTYYYPEDTQHHEPTNESGGVVMRRNAGRRINIQNKPQPVLDEREILAAHNVGHDYLKAQPTLEDVAMGVVTQMAQQSNENVKHTPKIDNKMKHLSPARTHVREKHQTKPHLTNPNDADVEDISMISAANESMLMPKYQLKPSTRPHDLDLSETFQSPVINPLSTNSSGHSKRVTIVTDPNNQSKDHHKQSRRRSKRRKKKLVKHNDSKPVIDKTPIDFNNYGATAQLWMEQVDKRAVQRSKTMQLTVMRETQPPPAKLISSYAEDAIAAHNASRDVDNFFDQSKSGDHQWVIAKGAYLNDNDCLPPCANEPVNLPLNSEGNTEHQNLVFFRVGTNWRKLAWRLFDGCLNEQETITMISDIEKKHPNQIRIQVHDLMSRWWTLKGDQATIDSLQRALDFVHIQYINEEHYEDNKSNKRKSLTDYVASESELDCSMISENDPDVSRLVGEYKVRSLNASRDSMTSQSDYDEDKILGRGPTEKALLSRLANCGLSKHTRRHKNAPLDKLTVKNTLLNRPHSSTQSRSKQSLNVSRESLGGSTIFLSDQGPGRRRNFNIFNSKLNTPEVL